MARFRRVYGGRLWILCFIETSRINEPAGVLLAFLFSFSFFFFFFPFSFDEEENARCVLLILSDLR